MFLKILKQINDSVTNSKFECSGTIASSNIQFFFLQHSSEGEINLRIKWEPRNLNLHGYCCNARNVL